jgi:hypothetical protein
VPGCSGLSRSRRNSSRSFMCSSGVSIQYRPRAAFRLLLVLCKLSEASSRRRLHAFGGVVSAACARPTALLPRFIVCHVAGVTTPHAADGAEGRQPAEITANMGKRRWKVVRKRASSRDGWIATGKTGRGDVVRSALRCGYVRSPGRLVLGKLACQAVFVISFYDLSRPIARPPFSAARTQPLPDHLRLGGSLSTRPNGPSPQPQGAAQSEPHIAAQKVLVKG